MPRVSPKDKTIKALETELETIRNAYNKEKSKVLNLEKERDSSKAQLESITAFLELILREEAEEFIVDPDSVYYRIKRMFEA